MTDQPPSAPPIPAEVQRAVADFTLKVCTPLYWHNRKIPFPKELRGGSCFTLRFGDRFMGITAGHVVRAYEQTGAQNPTTVCQLRTLPIELGSRVIDVDEDLDIATFALEEAELAQAGVVAIDVTDQWPPPALTRLRAVSVAGFPEMVPLPRSRISVSEKF